MKPLESGLLISGNLGFLALEFLSKHQLTNISFVFSDKKALKIIEFCQRHDIPFFTGNPRNNSTDVQQFLKAKPVDYIFSINYLFIVGKNILDHPRNFCINLHGSLLPKYRGRTPHVWAIINGEHQTGITAHIMNDGCDTGPIIKQKIIPIDYWDTGGDLLSKFTNEYPKLLDSILKDIQNNSIEVINQEHDKATYFGKRSPEDGEINWNWHKERIRNWVRAQAYPYPGAFSILRGEKIIIDEISYSDMDYSYDDPNGKIFKVYPKPYVKTPNGVIVLERTRNKVDAITLNSQFDSPKNHENA